MREGFRVAMVFVLSPLLIARAATLNVWVDVTRSVYQEARAIALQNLLAQLPSIIAEHNIGTVKLYKFGRGAWIVEAKEFRLPARVAVGCREPEIPAELKPIKSFRAAAMRRAEQECRTHQARTEEEYAAELNTALASIREAFVAVSPSGDTCTSVNDLLERISMGTEPGFMVVVTDARETCSKVVSRVSRPASDVHVVFLVVPSGSDWESHKSAAAVFGETKALLQRTAPWVHVVPLFSGHISDLFDDRATKKPLAQLTAGAAN